MLSVELGYAEGSDQDQRRWKKPWDASPSELPSPPRFRV